MVWFPYSKRPTFLNICIGSQFSSEKNVFQRPETMPSKALEISSTVTLPFFSWCFSGTKDGTASTPQTSELRRILISLLLNLSYLSGCERKGLNVQGWIEVSPGRYWKNYLQYKSFWKITKKYCEEACGNRVCQDFLKKLVLFRDSTRFTSWKSFPHPLKLMSPYHTVSNIQTLHEVYLDLPNM